MDAIDQEFNKVADELLPTDPHILTKMTFLQAQVCSTGTYDEALEWLRTTNAAGTSGNWQKDERPEAAPVQCGSLSDRTHYLFVC